MFKDSLPRAHPDDPITAENWNKLVQAIELMLPARGGQSYVNNAVGVFPVPETSDLRRYRLTSDLVGGIGTSADAVSQAWNDTDWISAGVTKTVWGDFCEAIPSDTLVQCCVAGGRLCVMPQGGGTSIRWGLAKADAGNYANVTVRIFEGPKSTSATVVLDSNGDPVDVDCENTGSAITRGRICNVFAVSGLRDHLKFKAISEECANSLSDDDVNTLLGA